MCVNEGRSVWDRLTIALAKWNIWIKIVQLSQQRIYQVSYSRKYKSNFVISTIKKEKRKLTEWVRYPHKPFGKVRSNARHLKTKMVIFKNDLSVNSSAYVKNSDLKRIARSLCETLAKKKTRYYI